MPDSKKDFATLMAELKEGSEEAVRELLDRYGDHIFRAVRRRMNHKMRAQFDSEDFCQAVWKSFFANRDENVDRFETPQELINFLKEVAKNKVIDEYRRGKRQGKGYDREQGVGSYRFILEDNGGKFAPEATPSQVISHEEQLDRLLGEESAMLQEFVEMRLNGVSFAAIARRFGISERSVRRAFKKLGQRLLDTAE